MENIKLIDCFPYFNETEILELRIKLLYNYVDKFVITEANQTHSGQQKEYTCLEVLNQIEDPDNKIELIQVDFSNNPEFDHWKRERVQRDAVLQILHKFDDDSLFYFGDCDEILNPDHIEWICNVSSQYPFNILRTPLAFLNCRADLRVFDSYDNPVSWRCPYIASKMHLGNYTPSQIRESCALSGNIEISELGRHINFSDITITCNDIEVILGWHFAWMGDNERRKIKCKSYLHYQDNIPSAIAPLNSDGMEKYMEEYSAESGCLDPLGRTDHILRKYSIDLLPSLILNEEKFKKFFLPDTDYQTIVELLEDNPEISTDKNTVKYYNKFMEWDFMQYHSYIDNFYNEEFQKYKGKSISLCEIGIDTGGSIAIWSKYFSDGNIIGIDNNTSRLKNQYQQENFHNVRYIIEDAYDQTLVDSLPNFDIIIDDGPHTFESQQEFIKLYSSKLNDGGVMIIEDVKSIEYIIEFDNLLSPGFTSEYVNLIETDNLYDSILYIIRK